MTSIMGYRIQDTQYFEAPLGRGFKSTLYKGLLLVGTITDHADGTPVEVRSLGKPEVKQAVNEAHSDLNALKTRFGVRCEPGSLLESWSEEPYMALVGLVRMNLELRGFREKMKVGAAGLEENEGFAVYETGCSFLRSYTAEIAKNRLVTRQQVLVGLPQHEEGGVEGAFYRSQTYKELQERGEQVNALAVFITRNEFTWDLDESDMVALYSV